MAALIQRRALLVIALLGFMLVAISGCDTPGSIRPVGYFRLGKVQDVLGTETNFADAGLLLRHDEYGFYVMNTRCTYDGTTLERRSIEGQELLVSSTSSSAYNLDGSVVNGPATKPLQYYELRLDTAEYGGVPDTLYAHVGVTKPSDWRLTVKELDE